MNGVILLAIGLSVGINIMIIKLKLERGRYLDAIIDGSLLGILTVVFGGSYGGLVTGTIASSVVSIWLWFSPPKINVGSNGKSKSNNPIMKDFSESLKQFSEDYKSK